jgi:hypothetical protein
MSDFFIRCHHGYWKIADFHARCLECDVEIGCGQKILKTGVPDTNGQMTYLCLACAEKPWDE